MAKGIGKVQSSPKISSGKGGSSPKSTMGNIRPAFRALSNGNGR